MQHELTPEVIHTIGRHFDREGARAVANKERLAANLHKLNDARTRQWLRAKNPLVVRAGTRMW